MKNKKFKMDEQLYYFYENLNKERNESKKYEKLIKEKIEEYKKTDLYKFKKEKNDLLKLAINLYLQKNDKSLINEFFIKYYSEWYENKKGE